MSKNEMSPEERRLGEAVATADMDAAPLDREFLEQLKRESTAAFVAAGTKPVREPVRKRRRLIRWLLPAAACLAAAALVGLWPREPVVQSAYAQLVAAVENSKKAEWMRLEFSADGGTAEWWLSCNPPRCVRVTKGVEQKDDFYYFCSYREGVESSYSGATGELKVADAPYIKGFVQGSDLLSIFMIELNDSQAHGATVKAERRRDQGREVTAFSVSVGGKTTEIVVDDEQNRMTRLRMEGLWSEVSYPATGPRDIYDLGVPRTAKVVDKRQRDRQGWELLCETEKVRARFPERLFAVVYVGTPDADGRLHGQRLNVYYQDGPRRRTHMTYFTWFHGDTRVGAVGIENLDGESLTEIERFMAERQPGDVSMILDGGRGVAYNLTHRDDIGKQITAGHPGDFRNSLWAWMTEYGKSLPPVQGPHGPLLVTQKLERLHHHTSTFDVPFWRRWVLCVNAARDYITERKVHESAFGDEEWVPEGDREALKAFQSNPDSPHLYPPGKTTTTVLEYGQTPNGHWYPRKRLREFEGPDGKVNQSVEIIHLDTTREIPGEVFDWQKFEAKLGRPIKER